MHRIYVPYGAGSQASASSPNRAARQVSGAGLGKENFIRFFACSSRAGLVAWPESRRDTHCEVH